jgi:hypothetical protein
MRPKPLGWKPPGWYWPDFKPELVIQRLLTCYGELTAFDKTPFGQGRWSNYAFMREFTDFVDRHADDLSIDTRAAAAPHVDGPTMQDAKRLADKWGLKAPWAPGRLIREATANVLRKQRSPNEWAANPLCIFPLLPIQVTHAEGTRHKRMWRERKLDRNIVWLYRRIALKETPEQIAIKDGLYSIEGDVEPKHAVEEAIRTLERLIGLEPTYTK